MSLYYQHNGLKVITSKLLLSPTDSMSGRRRVYRLTAPFTVMIKATGVNSTIRVPKDFDTDLATIPLIAQVFIGSRDDRGVAEAAVVHDWLCVQDAPRVYANSTMYYLLLAMSVPRWRAAAIFSALQLFGYKSIPSRLWRRVKELCSLET